MTDLLGQFLARLAALVCGNKMAFMAEVFVQHSQIHAAPILLARPEFETSSLFMRAGDAIALVMEEMINSEWTMDPARRNVNDMYALPTRHPSKVSIQ